VRVKICGITRYQDGKLALALGATELGFIFAPSPRKITIEQAKHIRSELPPETSVIGVFVNEKMDKILEVAKEVNLQGVQLHGDETPEDVAFLKREKSDLIILKSIGVTGNKFSLDASAYDSCDALVFDSAGSHFNPSERKSIETKITSNLPFYLAGGLNPKNVLELINRHMPFGIDLSSGLESSPGIKNELLLKELFSVLKESKCIPT
jgi:phosphoribosylanthranilate isomerase